MTEPRRIIDDPSYREDVRRLLASTPSIAPMPGAQARVWHRLASDRVSRPRWGVFALSSAAAVGGVLFGASSMDPGATGDRVEEAANRSGGLQPAVQVVSTPAEEARDVRLPAFESFRVSPGSQVRLLSEGALEVELRRGGLQFAARPNRPAFVLIAAPYTFRVHGAAAAVNRVGDRLSVRVARGRLELLGQGGPSQITAGSLVWLETSGPERNAPVAGSESVLETSGPERDAPVAGSESVLEASGDRAAPAVAELDVSRRADPRDPGALYRAARRIADPDEAQRLFDRVAATDGPWSDVAALRSIRLDLDRGWFESALARMERVAPKLRRSPFAPEFELDRIECLLRLDRSAAARRHARRFVARFPHHPRMPEVRRLAMRASP